MVTGHVYEYVQQRWSRENFHIINQALMFQQAEQQLIKWYYMPVVAMQFSR